VWIINHKQKRKKHSMTEETNINPSDVIEVTRNKTETNPTGITLKFIPMAYKKGKRQKQGQFFFGPEPFPATAEGLNLAVEWMSLDNAIDVINNYLKLTSQEASQDAGEDDQENVIPFDKQRFIKSMEDLSVSADTIDVLDEKITGYVDRMTELMDLLMTDDLVKKAEFHKEAQNLKVKMKTAKEQKEKRSKRGKKAAEEVGEAA
jgi:hypothetical protein